jgi:GNAT superfamily N-acetyltransferase
MSDLIIKFAVKSDFNEIYEFLVKEFFPYEDLSIAHRNKHEKTSPPKEFLKDSIENGITLLATISDKLVGVLVACELTKKGGDILAEKSLDLCEKANDVFTFVAYIEKKADYLNRLKIPSSLHIHFLSVHHDHLRKGIATKLFDVCVEEGKRKNYPAFSVDASSLYTSKIAENYEMTLISTVTYDEYHDVMGEKIFFPVPPHTDVKSYAKFYDKL